MAGPMGYPMPPQVVHVVARPGGFTRALLTMAGLMMFGFVFLTGIGLGAVSMMTGGTMKSAIVQHEYRAGGGDKIAIIPLYGPIGGAQSAFVRAGVDTVLADSSIRAVILRVDSPGGGVTASDQIWYQIKRLKDNGMPVLASYGSVAASGGYYASCHADHIMAEETSITGSIGVIAQTFIVKDLLDKVGVEPVTLLSSESPQKDVGNPYRAWEEHEREKIVQRLDSAYNIFLARVQDGRAAVIGNSGRVRELANGSVYTSDAALREGLIDGIGYLDDAVVEAEKMGGVATGRASVVWLRQPSTLFGSNTLLQGPETRRDPLDATAIREFVNELGSIRIMYLMP
jgi:protease-4